MTDARDIVFLFDIDNNLLDNDRVQADLSEHLETLRPASSEQVLANLRDADQSGRLCRYLGALELSRTEDLHCPALLRMANWIIDYPFADRLYPDALTAVKPARQWGTTVILSDGDAVFQPRKVERSGL